MVFVEKERLLRKRRTLRRERQDLALFLLANSAMIRSGWDLAFAWSKTLELLQKELTPDFYARFACRGPLGFQGFLEQFAQDYPLPEYRIWFGLLAEHYASGASLEPALRAFLKTLEGDCERDWQAHVRALPLLTTLVLAVFFLVPALALVFVPLVYELTESFR